MKINVQAKPFRSPRRVSEEKALKQFRLDIVTYARAQGESRNIEPEAAVHQAVGRCLGCGLKLCKEEFKRDNNALCCAGCMEQFSSSTKWSSKCVHQSNIDETSPVESSESQENSEEHSSSDSTCGGSTSDSRCKAKTCVECMRKATKDGKTAILNRNVSTASNPVSSVLPGEDRLN